MPIAADLLTSRDVTSLVFDTTSERNMARVRQILNLNRDRVPPVGRAGQVNLFDMNAVAVVRRIVATQRFHSHRDP